MPINPIEAVEKVLQEEEERKSKLDFKSENKYLKDLIRKQDVKIKCYEQPVKKIKPITFPKTNRRGFATVIAPLGDLHIEERVDLITTNGLNEYNPIIAAERCKNFAIGLLKLTEICRHEREIDTLFIPLLGDMINGFIHEEYIRTNYMTPQEATIFAFNQISSIFDLILKEGGFKRIISVCKVGNHSRSTHKVYTDTELVNSFEYMLYKLLENRFDTIEFLIEPNYRSYFQIYDKMIATEHGHAFRSAGGIGGIYPSLIKHVDRASKLRYFDLLIMGHWHSNNYDRSIRVLRNGCGVGHNGYAIKNGFQFEPPQQQFLLLDAEKGFTANYPIYL